jgi:hypothetical protein
MKKEWKLIGDQGQYRLSNYGELESCLKRGAYPCITQNWRKINPSKGRTDNHGGYYYSTQLCLALGEKPKVYRVHRLVMKYFVGDCPEGKEVNHIDGNRDNNRIDNLEYVTKKENLQNAVKRGSFVGIGAFKGKLKLDDLKEIENMYNSNVKIKEICKKFNVWRSTINFFIGGGFVYKPKILMNRKDKKYKRGMFYGVNKTYSNTFSAKITIDKYRYHIGTYKTIEEAADAYNKVSFEFYGSRAELNNLAREMK